ncbi:MAG: hypothetical protein Q7J25_12680 [Vicinamibacterales bacterium]|nr:hypothetical protein [Vicinamibacterales bacterium]
MGHIDDPIDQIESQHPPESGPEMLAKVLNILSPIVAIVNPAAGTGLSIAAYFKQIIDDQRSEVRMGAWQQGLKDGLRDHDRRIVAIEKKVSGVDAEEAVVASARGAILAARADKAYRMGRVIGSTIASEAPNWKEAAEFIGDLESFTDDDLAALNLLWKLQRQAFRVMTSGGVRQMSTDANDYTPKWKDALEAAQETGASIDDWYSRCARLMGFGLAVLVQPNASHQGPDAMCYRLTTRAVRLLAALGRNMAYGAYPRVLYRAGGQTVTVDDEDAHKALTGEWFETPQP